MTAASTVAATVRLPPTLFAPFVVATVLAGVAAGFFFAYSANVVLALGQVSGTTYAAVMQPINETVRNPAFAAVFFGSALVPVAGLAALVVRQEVTTGYGLLFLAGLLVYLGGTVVVTATVHLPLNDYIATWTVASPPQDWTTVRSRWARWNLVRTVAAGLAFALYGAATVALAVDAAGAGQ